MSDSERLANISTLTVNFFVFLYGVVVTSLWWAASIFGCVSVRENFIWILWVFAVILSIPVLIGFFVFIGYCLNLKENEE